MKLVVLAFFLLISPVTFAAAKGAAKDQAVPASQFRAQFQSGMIEGLCRETKFTAECYQMEAAACEANVKSSIAKCMRDKPPAKEVPKDRVGSYSVELGKCVGQDFSARNKSRLRGTPECQNPQEWLGR